MNNQVFIKKEMEYGDRRKVEVIGYGNYQGRDWVILSLGSYPTAYVKLTREETNRLFGRRYFEDIDVHGGCTWLDTFVPIRGSKDFQNVEDHRLWFGWDYAHFGDYYCENFDGKKYTTDEVYTDVVDVVDQLNNFDWNNL